jgi:hypothetical protein
MPLLLLLLACAALPPGIADEGAPSPAPAGGLALFPDERVGRDRCVPAMVVTVAADPVGFFKRLSQSIDFCVSNLVVVKPAWMAAADETLASIRRNATYIRRLTVVALPYKLMGVAEGWNAGLRACGACPWQLVCSSDVYLPPDMLRRFSNRFWNASTSGQERLHVAYVNWRNAAPGGFNFFALTGEVLAGVGYFDENYFPVSLHPPMSI